MIEPLRHRASGPKTNARLYREVSTRPDCAMCRVRYKRQRQAKWTCEECRGKPLCHECDFKAHLKTKNHKHRRHLLVTGHPWRHRIVHPGDQMTYPKVFDWVSVHYQCKVDNHVVDDSRWKGQPLKFQAGCSGPCLHVQILGCDRIHAADLMGTSDPYVALFWNDKYVGHTPTRIMTLNPRWARETFVMPLSPELAEAHNTRNKKALAGQRVALPTLRAELYDYDAFSKNDFLGQISFSEVQLFRLLKKNEPPPARRFKLKPKAARGTLGVGMTKIDHPINGRSSLFIRVCNAEKLARSDAFSLSDPYVKIFFNDKFVGKTSVEFDTIDPEWPVETAQFEIPLHGEEVPLASSMIRLEVYDHDTIGSHDPLGQTTLSPRDIDDLLEMTYVPPNLRKHKKKKKKKKKKKDKEGEGGGEEAGYGDEESKEDSVVEDVTEGDMAAAEAGKPVKKVRFTLPEPEPGEDGPEGEGAEAEADAEGAEGAEDEGAAGDEAESSSSDEESDEEADYRAAQWSEAYSKLSCTYLCGCLPCCKRKKAVDAVDLSNGLKGYGRRKMRKRDLEKHKRYFPLVYTADASCKDSVRGSMSIRLVYSDFGSVVRGLDLGVQSMSIGEKATIKVRHDYGYSDGFGTHEIAPGSNLDYRVEFVSLNGHSARYYKVKRRVVKVGRCIAKSLFCFQSTWLAITGCPLPECLCPCCYIEIEDEDPYEGMTPEQREQMRTFDEVSYEDSVEESIQEKVSLLDQDEELTDAERAALARRKNRGLFSLFSGVSVLEKEAKLDHAEDSHEAVVRQQHRQEEAHMHDGEGAAEHAQPPSAEPKQPQAQEMER